MTERTFVSIDLADESALVLARGRTKDVAEVLGMSTQDQTRLATAVSELCRNAWSYARKGKLELTLLGEPPEWLVARVSDEGPGIAELEHVLSGQYVSKTGMGRGLIGSRKLVDRFEIQTGAEGTVVTVGKKLPAGASTRTTTDWVLRITQALAGSRPRDATRDVREQNRELLLALDELRTRDAELEDANRQLNQANRELEDTNRGVVALYAELDARAEFARKASELKTRFLSHLSHEFRTPLGSVLALSDLLLARLDGPLTPEQETQIKLIKKSVATLSDLVEDLLDIAKVEAGKANVRPAEFTVADVFNALRGMVRPLMTNPDVQLIFEADEVQPLRTDEGKVSQILRNLVSNALKFTERGEIRVRASADAGDRVRITVADTGLGIAKKNLERVFEEFVQVENPLQQKHKGTGLGLPLSRKLAQVLGGTLTVESEEGKGACFTLVLPRVLSAQPAGQPFAFDGEQTLASGYGRRILVVDDHDALRYLVGSQLRAAGYDVEEAPGGLEAVQRALGRPPDGVLLDLTMPDLSGYDVLAQLKAAPATAKVPVIIYTSRTLSDEDLERLSAASAIVGKPDAARRPGMVDLAEALLRSGLAGRRDDALG